MSTQTEIATEAVARRHATHRMDSASLEAYRKLRPEVLRSRITDLLSLGIPRTAKEVATLLNAPLVTTRSRLSDGCNEKLGPPIYRKAVRVEEEGSATKVWAFALETVHAELAL